MRGVDCGPGYIQNWEHWAWNDLHHSATESELRKIIVRFVSICEQKIF